MINTLTDKKNISYSTIPGPEDNSFVKMLTAVPTINNVPLIIRFPITISAMLISLMSNWEKHKTPIRYAI